jgi:hypothetical protein
MYTDPNANGEYDPPAYIRRATAKRLRELLPYLAEEHVQAGAHAEAEAQWRGHGRAASPETQERAERLAESRYSHSDEAHREDWV